jgi:ribosomal protein S18 acetylase RimI-like enzyme
MDIIKIKKATLSDIDHLKAIAKQTFFETFADYNTADDMQKYLEDNFNLEKLTSELTNQYSEFYFALFDNKVVGYLKINFSDAQTELKDKDSIEIERIYVLEAFQGKKVGQLLHHAALTIAKQKNVNYMWLGVWEKNVKAINFYKKNGFVEFDKHIFKLGNDEQTDLMMRLKLN